MGLMQQLEVSWEELVDQVDRDHWEVWCAEESALTRYGSLADLASLRGSEGDRAFGALLRLASQHGANDRLAALAAMHRLGSCLQRMAISMSHECPDVDALLLGSAWIEIVTYPVDRPRRGHATHILRAVRLALLRHLKPSRDRHGREWERVTDPVQLRNKLDVASASGHCGDDSEHELHEMLHWALQSEILAPDQIELLLKLVEADRGSTTPPSRRGVTSLASVHAVAELNGVCGKTVIRSRDKAIATLREAVLGYLAEVA